MYSTRIIGHRADRKTVELRATPRHGPATSWPIFNYYTTPHCTTLHYTGDDVKKYTVQIPLKKITHTHSLTHTHTHEKARMKLPLLVYVHKYWIYFTPFTLSPVPSLNPGHPSLSPPPPLQNKRRLMRNKRGVRCTSSGVSSYRQCRCYECL